MKKALILSLFTFVLCSGHYSLKAQQNKLDSIFAKADTTAVMDSLMEGFDAYMDSLSQPSSFFSLSVGMGNRNFSVKNNSLNTQETTRQLSFTPTAAYYHKSGLGISVTGFAANLGNSFHFYQYAITPSYDYIGDKVSAGISYTRYLGKDTATVSASPYDNDIYGYVYLRHKNWRYGITAGYATGRFYDKVSYSDSVYKYITLLQRYGWVYVTKTIASENHIKDLSLSASVRKDIEWDGLLRKTDNLRLSFTGYLVTGLSKIQTSTNVNYATAKKLSLAKFSRSYSSADGNGFQLQSAVFSVGLFYTIGQFNIQPVYFMDYYFPDTDQKFSQVFSLTVAYTF